MALLLSPMPAADGHAAQNPTPFERDCGKLAADKQNDAERLHDLFKLHWDHTMSEHPELATEVGWPGYNDRWTDLSPEAVARRKRERRAPLQVAQSIDRARLDPADQLNYDLFRREIEEAIAGDGFPEECLQINQLRGVHLGIADLLKIAPRRKIKDYEEILSRLNTAPRLIDQTIDLLSKGVEAGITPPRIALRDVPQQVQNQIGEDPERNPILQLFADFPAEVPPEERGRLRGDAAEALQTRLFPAFRKLHDYLTERYLPAARETIAWGDLPDGKAWYEYNVRRKTTTAMTVGEIHELGLSEMKRIRRETEKVIAESGFKGTFEKFLEFMRSDARFYYPDAESLLAAYRDICKRADPETARLFGRLPRLPYGVLPVPAYAEKSQPTAYYQAGSPAAGRPAVFYANIYALHTRPKWEMEALSLHEAVPGHHLQIALAQEMEGLPEFRRHYRSTAYVEGWGLYAESLGDEMGFYQDPFMKFGRLTYEMWRAIRLVVDTGMHALGWSRRKAIDCFLANSGKSEHDATVEVDRYIVWPGQALAYKIGQLKIKALRESARRELPDRYDVRVFHDRILESGALPLDILERRIQEWIIREKNR